MLLSVIVPVYNERDTLGTALVLVARALPNVRLTALSDCTQKFGDVQKREAGGHRLSSCEFRPQ